MSDSISIQPTGPVHGTIRPPGSKSITNRALLCAALAKGTSTLHGALDSDDTRYMIDGLRALGIAIQSSDDRTQLVVDGCHGKIPAQKADLFLGNSGTSIRFLTAAASLGHGEFRLDGVARMRQRPIQDLLDALNQLGVQGQSEFGNGCPPIQLKTNGLPGGQATVAGNISSQYLSGLLMVAAYANQAVTLNIAGELVSRPYVDMTLAVLQAFDIQVTRDDNGYSIQPQSGRSTDYSIEPDASAASYFWAAAAITGGRVTVEGLTANALQGDVRFVDCLQQMGCTVEHGKDQIRVTGGKLQGIDIDMNSISDTVQTLAAVALFADGPTTIRGVAHNRHKETDRIGDLATELRRTTATVTELPDGLVIEPPPALQPATFETYDDHRMAMSLALIGLRQPGIVINDPSCTFKTYPNYFADLQRLTRS